MKAVNQHPTTRNNLILGLPKQQVFGQVIGGGQAEFDTPYLHLSGADRALLYAYMNQPGHVAELIEAFTQLFKNGPPEDPLIVADVGCGPCTGGLALAAVLGVPFTYIGLDRYASDARSWRAAGLRCGKFGSSKPLRTPVGYGFRFYRVDETSRMEARFDHRLLPTSQPNLRRARIGSKHGRHVYPFWPWTCYRLVHELVPPRSES